MERNDLSGELGRRELKGSPASPGVVIGVAHVVHTRIKDVPKRTLLEKSIPGEITRFKRALQKTHKQILESQKLISKKLGSEISRIFDAHLLLLKDELVIEETTKVIRTEKVGAEYAFFKTISQYLEKMSEISDEYLREREIDIRDVGRRVINNLSGGASDSIPKLKKRVILVAREMTPSMTAGLARNKVIGLATDVSGKTSHAVIFARSLEIPAVVGLHSVTQQINTGDKVILDGISGKIIANPSEDEIEKYNEKVRQFREFEEELSQVHHLPAVTVDGYRVQLSANIEIPQEVKSLIAHGATGVGLFRTEFLLLDREEEPGEDEQCRIYSQVVKKVSPDPVTIRTYDIGGDKYVKFLDNTLEANPYLGWRAIRISLECESLFRTQLRALLRSSSKGNLRVMFPMITCVEELERALTILDEEEKKLRGDGVEIDEGYEIGIMIETPAAAMISDKLAKRVDFFSVGTNDLIQYTMAADRDNSRVSHLYQQFHPGVLGLIHKTIEAARENGVSVSVCGEMAGNPLGAILLVGMGVYELSMSPVLVPEVKVSIRSIAINDAREAAREALAAETHQEVLEILKDRFESEMSDLFLL